MAAVLRWKIYKSAEYVQLKAYSKSNGKRGFTIKQACMSSDAESYNYANQPNDTELERLRETLRHVNEIVKTFEQNNPDYGVWIESGYRSECVNNVVGGKPYSGHRVGGAVDLKVYRKSDYKTSYTYDKDNPTELLLKTAAEYIIANNVTYNEFLREIKGGGYWFHLAITGNGGNKNKWTYTLGSGKKNYMDNYYGLTYKHP